MEQPQPSPPTTISTTISRARGRRNWIDAMLLFEHASLIDCTGADPRSEMSIVVEDGRIARIAPSGSFAIAPGTAVIDCQGRTLMAGLIDAHVHLAAIDIN